MIPSYHYLCMNAVGRGPSNVPLGAKAGILQYHTLYFSLTFLFFFYSPVDGEQQSLSSPHFHVFSYTSCVCRFNSIAFAIQRQLTCPSVPTTATVLAVPTGGPRYYSGSAYSGSASCRCIRMRECVDPACPTLSHPPFHYGI